MAKRFSLFLFTCIYAVNLVFGQTGLLIPSEQFSSGLINNICQDSYGQMWIATDYGLNKYDGYRFTTYLHEPDDSTSLNSNVVTAVFCDFKGCLWVGTGRGLCRYNYESDDFERMDFGNGLEPRITFIDQWRDSTLLAATSGYGLYRILPQTNTAMMKVERVPGGYTVYDEDNFFDDVLQDSKGCIWKRGFTDRFTMYDGHNARLMRSTQGYVIRFIERYGEILIFCMHGIHSYRNGQLTVADIDMSVIGKENIIRRVFCDRQHNIYIGTRGNGLFRLPHDSNRIERVQAFVPGIDFTTSKIWAITQDHDNNIWVGCQSLGLVMLPAEQPKFQSWQFSTQGLRLGSSVTSICEGDDGMTWCTVQGNGVFGFDSLGHVVAHPEAPAPVECIFRDRRKRYWIGTDKSLYAYDPLTGQAVYQMTFDCDRFQTMTDDAAGNLYISAFSRGFIRYNPETRQVVHYDAGSLDPMAGALLNDWVLYMTTDRYDRLWLATSIGISCYDTKTYSFRSFKWDHLLEGKLCFSLCATRSGDIIIGTDQGLYRYVPGAATAELFPGSEMLRNKIVSYIVEDEHDNLWCSTSMGIWQYDRQKKIFVGYLAGKGLTTKEYQNSVGLRMSDGRICFAGGGGLTVFYPSQITDSEEQLPHVRLTSFLVAGKPASGKTLSNGEPVMSGSVLDCDHFSVSYLDNSLTLEFSLLDFSEPSNVIYEYRIDGGRWRQNAEGQNAIQLTRLQPGSYCIEVRALAGGIYSPLSTYHIEVTPPWYRSVWAYIIYALILVVILVQAGISLRRRAKRQLDEAKMRFLINATHDIRSPLTLIMGAISKLKNVKMEEAKSSEDITNLKAQLSTPIDAIDRNAQRLLLLVNQILDERRLDKNQMQLHCQETNLVSFISGICKLYQFGADQRGMTFTFEHEKDNVLAWVDRTNFDKVVSNLLSNAFKFTPDGGEVKIVIRDDEKKVVLQVIDNGIGFKDANPDRLFDRFYQGENSANLGMQGTGIGLNLCRAITQLHGGTIKAQKRTDGQGACFVITLPKGNRHLRKEQIKIDSPVREVLSKGSSGKLSFRPAHILIVDDEEEIASYIMDELGDRYKFDHASNGKEGLKMLLTDSYDLVISDVMMPEMDGLTLLKRIKDNPQISQLPVIMLTSKVEVEHKLEGLKSGADAYIAKPFDMEELHIQIDNLLEAVRRLRGKFSGAVSQEERVENIEVKGNDDALMERIMRSVNAHLSNPDYNVDMLAADVGISRAQLHRKMKEMTGIATGKFLRNLRMEQAARLLREGKINVSQISDRVGYADQAHFSTAFKAHFGLSPSEYAEKNMGI